MEDAVCRDDKRDMRVVIVAFEAGDGAASFADDDDAGGGIPRFEVYLPKASSQPAATQHKSRAAEPGRRTEWTLSETLPKFS